MFRKKSVITTLVIMGLALFVAGIAYGALTTYSNKTEKFSIGYPSNWQKHEGYEGSVVMFISPAEYEGDSFSENINIFTSDLPGGYSLSQYYSLNLEDVKENLKGVKIYEQKDVTINGMPAKYVIYTYEAESMGTLKVLQYFIVNKTKGYVITCGAPPNNFQKYQDTFKSVANSFKAF